MRASTNKFVKFACRKNMLSYLLNSSGFKSTASSIYLIKGSPTTDTKVLALKVGCRAVFVILRVNVSAVSPLPVTLSK